MIKLHRLNGEEVIINADLIESVSPIPDTKIVLITGNQLIVRESTEEVIQLTIKYRQQTGYNPAIKFVGQKDDEEKKSEIG